MRKTAAVPAIALLLVTGCSTAEAQPRTTSSPALKAAQAAVETVKDSEEQTCTKLLGADGKGPLYQAVSVIRIGDGVYSFDGPLDAVRPLGAELRALTDAAPDDMIPPLGELSSQLESAMLQVGTPNQAGTFDPSIWSGTVGELLTRCAPYDAGQAPVPPADGISAAFPGYPLVVNAASVDYRVAAWFGDRLVDGRVVALAPGLYSPFDPSAADLLAYYDSANVAGNSAMKQTVFPGSSRAASWSGVRPGVEEPQ